MKERENTQHTEAMMGMVMGTESVDVNIKMNRQSMNNSDQIPVMDADIQQALELAGVKILGAVESDPLFLNVILPEGWTKKATSHHMYTDLLDEQGRKRGSIMYKGCSYDRDARTSGSVRFRATYDNDSWQDPTLPKNAYVPVIQNSNGKIVWRGKPVVGNNKWQDEPLPYPCDDSTRDIHDANDNDIVVKQEYFYSPTNHATHIACQILETICPQYKDEQDFATRMGLYWDTEPVWPTSLSDAPKGESYEVYVGLYDSGNVHHDSGHHCDVRGETPKIAWEKAVEITLSFQKRYHRLDLTLRDSDGTTVKHNSFTKELKVYHRARRDKMIDNGLGYFNGDDDDILG